MNRFKKRRRKEIKQNEEKEEKTAAAEEAADLFKIANEINICRSSKNDFATSDDWKCILNETAIRKTALEINPNDSNTFSSQWNPFELCYTSKKPHLMKLGISEFLDEEMQFVNRNEFALSYWWCKLQAEVEHLENCLLFEEFAKIKPQTILLKSFLKEKGLMVEDLKVQDKNIVLQFHVYCRMRNGIPQSPIFNIFDETPDIIRCNPCTSNLLSPTSDYVSTHEPSDVNFNDSASVCHDHGYSRSNNASPVLDHSYSRSNNASPTLEHSYSRSNNATPLPDHEYTRSEVGMSPDHDYARSCNPSPTLSHDHDYAKSDIQPSDSVSNVDVNELRTIVEEERSEIVNEGMNSSEKILVDFDSRKRRLLSLRDSGFCDDMCTEEMFEDDSTVGGDKTPDEQLMKAFIKQQDKIVMKVCHFFFSICRLTFVF